MSTPLPGHAAEILIVDADLLFAQELGQLLTRDGHQVELCAGGPRLKRLVREHDFAVVVSDPSTADLDFFLEAYGERPRPAIVLVSGFGSVEDAVGAMRAGAFDYICKPAPFDQLQVAVARALERRRLQDENRQLRADLGTRFELGRVLSRDPQFQRVFQTVEALADTRATILIEGESGTGKTLLARTIHQRSGRASAPFIEVNCGALSESLLESELFGHARGAFTGALRDKPGKFEAADGGTLFLDEIACASLELQIKLLRVLQDRSFERVGETRTRTADVRVIAASNRELQQEVAALRFREDLYYRIHVVALRLPPLRERPGDIPLLAEHFRERFASEYRRPARAIHPECMALLTAHAWPGNVRELEHCLERAVLFCNGPEVLTHDLGPELQRATERPVVDNLSFESWGGSPALVPGLCSLRSALEAPEREIIRRALEHNQGNRKATARMLDVNRTTLFNKMKKYNLMEFEVPRD